MSGEFVFVECVKVIKYRVFYFVNKIKSGNQIDESQTMFRFNYYLLSCLFTVSISTPPVLQFSLSLKFRFRGFHFTPTNPILTLEIEIFINILSNIPVFKL